MEVSDQLHASAALLPKNNLVTVCIRLGMLQRGSRRLQEQKNVLTLLEFAPRTSHPLV